MIRTIQHIPKILISLLAIMISGYAFSFLWVNHGFLGSKGALTGQLHWQIAFHMHFLGGGLALALGWSQFWAGLRKRYVQLHRNLGAAYVMLVLIAGAPGGFYLALYANGGFPNMVGFGMLGLLWFFTTAKAFYHIRNKNIGLHKIWMIRSYSLCLAAVALRFWLPLFIFALGVSSEEAYATVAWFCWVPNIIAAEWVIDRGFVKD